MELQDMRGRGMSGECVEGLGGMMREQESVEESLVRNYWEVSSGRDWNWEGRMRGVPKTSSAGSGWKVHGGLKGRRGGRREDVKPNQRKHSEL